MRSRIALLEAPIRAIPTTFKRPNHSTHSVTPIHLRSFILAPQTAPESEVGACSVCCTAEALAGEIEALSRPFLQILAFESS